MRNFCDLIVEENWKHSIVKKICTNLICSILRFDLKFNKVKSIEPQNVAFVKSGQNRQENIYFTTFTEVQSKSVPGNELWVFPQRDFELLNSLSSLLSSFPRCSCHFRFACCWYPHWKQIIFRAGLNLIKLLGDYFAPKFIYLKKLVST
jgi:hypothetical protein